MKTLSETMTPIVLEVLRTAGERGVMDRETAERLIQEAGPPQASSSQNAPAAETLQAVSRVLGDLGDDVLPALVRALREPNEGEPPLEVREMILKLRKELSLDETATAEDVLSRLVDPGE